MKKTILRILLWVARTAGSFGIGWLFGTAANWVLGKILDEDFIEKHPYVSLCLWILGVAVATGASLLVVTYPLTWVFEWFDKKVDDIVDDPDWES